MVPMEKAGARIMFVLKITMYEYTIMNTLEYMIQAIFFN